MSSKCGVRSLVPVELSDISPCLAFPRDAMALRPATESLWVLLRPYLWHGQSTCEHAPQAVHPSVSQWFDSNSALLLQRPKWLLRQRELVDVDVADAEALG